MREDSLILGIDSSLNETGICILDIKGKIVHCESINPYPLLGSSRLNYIYERYIAIFHSFPGIDTIGFERQVSQQRYNSNAKYILELAEGFGILKLALYQTSLQREVDVYQFTAQDLKIYAVNNGRATKEDMIKSLPVRILKKVESYVIPSAVDDVVDAYYCAMRTLSLVKSNEEVEKVNYLYLSSRKEVSEGG